MNEPQLSGVLSGFAFFIIGVILIIWREAITQWSASGQRRWLGKVGERVARESRPSSFILGGVGLIVAGALIVLLSF